MLSVAAKPSRMSGTVSLSDAGTRSFIGRQARASGPGASSAFDLESGAQQLRIHHQRHQPASGHRQLRRRPAEHPQVLLAGRNVQALLRLQELLAARLLANAHAPRRILRLALHVVDRAEPAGQQRLDRLGLLVDHARPHREQIDDLARNLRAVEQRVGAGPQELRAIRVERDGAVDLALLERARLLVRLEVHDVDVARLHAVERQRPAQHERAERAAFHRDRLALEVVHRPHAATAHDHVGAVRHVDHQDDPRLQPVRGEPEQLVQADDHAVDGLVAKRAQDFARRRILDELHGRRIQATQLPREVERLAPDPDVGADAQGGFRLAHAAGERKQQRDARERRTAVCLARR